MIAVPGALLVWCGYEPLLCATRIPPEGLVVGRELLAARFGPVPDDRISRQHLRLRIEGDRIAVEDLGSQNGSYIDGQATVHRTTHVFPPVIVRTGRSVWVVVADVRRYEDVALTHADRVVLGGTMRAAFAAVDAAVRDDSDLAIVGPQAVRHMLAQRYVEAHGGTSARVAPSSGAGWDGVAARTIVLDASARLDAREGDAVRAWLASGVRVVTVARDRQWSSRVPAPVVARLAAREIEIPPRIDELPTTLADVIRELAPEIRLHAKAVEYALIRAYDLDEDTLIEQFASSVKRLRNRRETLMRAEDVELVDLTQTLDGRFQYYKPRLPRPDREEVVPVAFRKPRLPRPDREEVVPVAFAREKPESASWARRRLCADGACIGVIGGDGRCRVCGKPALAGSPYR